MLTPRRVALAAALAWADGLPAFFAPGEKEIVSMLYAFAVQIFEARYDVSSSQHDGFFLQHTLAGLSGVLWGHCDGC